MATVGETGNATTGQPPARQSPVRRQGYRSMLHYSRMLHTYLSMLATVLFIFFASTGFMLNHPVWFHLDANPQHRVHRDDS